MRTLMQKALKEKNSVFISNTLIKGVINMINKVANHLIASIKNKQSKSKINKLAKILFRIASESLYKEKVIENFIEMYSSLDESLISYISDGRRNVFYVDEDNVKPIKKSRLSLELLAQMLRNRSVEEIEEFSNSLAENRNTNTKELQSVVNQVTGNIYNIDIINTNKRDAENKPLEYNFTFHKIYHFGHRQYLREVTEKTLYKTLVFLSRALVQGWDWFVTNMRGDRMRYTTQIEHPLGGKVVIVFSLKDKVLTPKKNISIDLISVFPTYSPPPRYFVDSNIKLLNQVELSDEKCKVKPQTQLETEISFLKSPNSYSISEFVDLYSRIQKERQEKTLKVTYKNIENQAERLEISFPKELEFAVGSDNLKRLALRLGVIMSDPEIASTPSLKIKIQIPCSQCRYPSTGATSTKNVDINLNIQNMLPSKIKIVSFEMKESRDTPSRSWWELKVV